MEIEKAIELLQTLYVKSAKMQKGRLVGGYVDKENETNTAIRVALIALERYLYFANCMNCNCCDGEGRCEKFDIDVDEQYDGCTFYEN